MYCLTKCPWITRQAILNAAVHQLSLTYFLRLFQHQVCLDFSKFMIAKGNTFNFEYNNLEQRQRALGLYQAIFPSSWLFCLSQLRGASGQLSEDSACYLSVKS